MSELLTSLDIVNQAFKKTMRGYDPAEVDEFLDHVAECLQVYAQKTKDYEREIETHLEKLADYERLKDSLQEALVMAQKTAEERISNATEMADNIVAEARSKAEGLIADARAKAENTVRKAEEDVVVMSKELEKLDALRTAGFAAFRDLMHQISSAINNAESEGKLHLPELAQDIASRGTRTSSSSSYEKHESILDTPKEKEPVKKLGIADTLTALGIDPKLLETDPTKK